VTIRQIITWARKHNRIRGGVVLCENCDNPALKSAAVVMPWVGCGACYFGEADAVDYSDVIYINNSASANSGDAA
jgi:hypothetical protein